MKRRISRKRKLALEQLAIYYRWCTPLGSGSNAAMGVSAQTGGVSRYAKLWLLATGELPTGIHEVPWGQNAGWNWGRGYSSEVDYDKLHIHPSCVPQRGFSGPPAPPLRYGWKAVKTATR